MAAGTVQMQQPGNNGGAGNAPVQPSPNPQRDAQPDPGSIPAHSQLQNPQPVATPQYPAQQIASPPSGKKVAAQGALPFQFENIARQIGERLKVQMNESIDEFVVKLAEDLKKSLADVPNPAALSQHLQASNLSPEPWQGKAGQKKTGKKRKGFFSKTKAPKKAKAKNKVPQHNKKPGFFSRFRKKKAPVYAQQPASKSQTFQQPLYPPPIQNQQSYLSPNPQQQNPQQAYPQQRLQPQQASPQQRPQPQQASPQQRPQPQPQQASPQQRPQPQPQQASPQQRPQPQPQQASPQQRLQSQQQQMAPGIGGQQPPKL